MKKKLEKINWKKGRDIAVLITAGTGLFILGMITGKVSLEKKLEIENKLLERELTVAQNQFADLTRRYGSLSYIHGKLADRFATYRKRKE